MSGGISEQRNPYKGTPPRSWIRVQLLAPDGSMQEIDLLADTGNPAAIIVSDDLMRRFTHLPLGGQASNFGPLTGGALRVVIPDVGFDGVLIGYASDRVVRTAKASSPDFEGLAGLPLLRMLEYGGDSDWFWIRPLGSNP
jgi:hypothetical protein